MLFSCGNQINSQESQKTQVKASLQADCPEDYSPVCGQPPMPPCPAGMACAQVMPPVKTYSNRCEMENSGATFMNEGECRGAPL